jgi:hypothetical protein
MLASLLLGLPALPSALAWGAAGHEIVATIAQIHLRPDVRDKLCDILPAQAKCHLAPIAAWADQVRGRYPGSGPMHYINGECAFGGVCASLWKRLWRLVGTIVEKGMDLTVDERRAVRR